jgi:hypothetical protein
MQGEIEYFETQVAAFVAADPGIFLQYQFPIRNEKGQEIRWIDVLAVELTAEPSDMRFWIVEVTTGERQAVQKLYDRVRKDLGRTKDFKRSITNDTQVPEPELRWWVFVRKKFVDDLRTRFGDVSETVRITAVEKGACPWEYRAYRAEGELE